MFRLSAPTRRTFGIAFAAIVVGILAWLDPFGFDVDTAAAFWLTAGGSIFLALGNLFNRL